MDYGLRDNFLSTNFYLRFIRKKYKAIFLVNDDLSYLNDL